MHAAKLVGHAGRRGGNFQRRHPAGQSARADRIVPRTRVRSAADTSSERIAGPPVDAGREFGQASFLRLRASANRFRKQTCRRQPAAHRAGRQTRAAPTARGDFEILAGAIAGQSIAHLAVRSDFSPTARPGEQHAADIDPRRESALGRLAAVRRIDRNRRRSGKLSPRGPRKHAVDGGGGPAFLVSAARSSTRPT